MKSELKRGKGLKLALLAAFAGVLILGWSSLYLPGRIPWLPYSFPASAVSSGGEVAVPVPSDAANGTQWRLVTTLGSTPETDVSQLKVTRYLSVRKLDPGEEIGIGGTTCRYMGLRRLTDSSTAAVLQRR